jgi:hypothetical protein
MCVIIELEIDYPFYFRGEREPFLLIGGPALGLYLQVRVSNCYVGLYGWREIYMQLSGCLYGCEAKRARGVGGIRKGNLQLIAESINRHHHGYL